MKEHGFYIIKDKFFEDFSDPFLKGNKAENRPHYYAMKDNKTGLYWMIPLSSRIEKYKTIIRKKESQNKRCDTLLIIEIAGKESVLVIQDIFPVSEEYILRPYTINNVPLVLQKESIIKDIQKKATKVLGLRRRGIKLLPTEANIFKIEETLTKKKNN